MPFRNKAWEELQRDAAIFPAYTDYLFGPDVRPEATEEPGLHPLLFPPQPHTPIRYTNSRPSQTWSHDTAQGTLQPDLAAMQPQFGERTGKVNEDCSTDTGFLDLRSPVRSPMGKLLPPQSFQPDSAAEMARRRMPNTAQHRSPHRSLQRSSSATDIDEQLVNVATQ